MSELVRKKQNKKKVSAPNEGKMMRGSQSERKPQRKPVNDTEHMEVGCTRPSPCSSQAWHGREGSFFHKGKSNKLCNVLLLGEDKGLHRNQIQCVFVTQ